MTPFYGLCSTASRPLRGGSLLFTTKFPEISGTHFVDHRRIKGWVNLGATQWFWTCLYACNKSTSSLTFFLTILQRNSSLVTVSNLACLAAIKMIVSIWRNLWCLSASKKPISFSPFSLRYCKNIAKFLF